MKTIALSRGKVALVDDEDYDLVSGMRWHALHQGRVWYAQSAVRQGSERISMLMHRLILGLEPRQRVPEVDHVNGDGLDNRRANLRFATKSENQANMRLPARNWSGFRGVTWVPDRGSWQARVKYQGRTLHLGRFRDVEDAARAYDAKAVELFGEFARTNFPEPWRAPAREVA